MYPLDTHRNEAGHLVIGGCDVVDLVQEFGSPLYVYDEATIRAMCRSYVDVLAENYPNFSVTYAGKAYIDLAVLRIVADEGFGLDAVSGGEIQCAVAAEFPMERVIFHGNNKLPDEIELGLSAGIGRFMVDGLDDLRLISQVASDRQTTANVMLRLTPGISAHTHDYIRTGALDSKFGLPISTGQAEEAVRLALESSGVSLIGYHAHIGSQIFDTEPYAQTVEVLLGFAEQMHDKYGVCPEVLSPGGGCGVQYVEEDDGLEIERLVKVICRTFKDGLPAGVEPELALEPGRSIVANAGVALYSVGTLKEIPGIRKYVAVDGGMADNIRPALYGSEYKVDIASREADGECSTVTIAGRYCESGDILFKDVSLPELRNGDIVAAATSGAYNLAMSSNYNMALRPAVVFVKDGQATLSRRRETYDDLLAVFPGA
ncbi:MAG: diaminopimelate decarboxylase [Chloroflexi bacterium]|nr:diaminopimelate decarboxylase [Chloroflexota bacterium]MCY3937945.1 diaminopimelate decarboxylase [Chloroflexota bacterium]